MAKCVRCGKEFDVDDSREEFNDEFDGDVDYDEEYAGEVCANCAIPDTESNINAGAAIDMMNGEIAYDADHVERWL
ncbi:hypothetical protein [Agromyces humi]|uniref:hypothetical protein n=1 Tax=Agromyces humi TaxID=1766800 RepID=UPI00135CB375|nr:hypothetical protein [Agromyces humi]